MRKIYGTLHTLFEDFVADGVIKATPCKLRKGDLPKNADKDREWRSTARFTPEEVEALISDARIPADRRLLYGLLFLTGARYGEAAGLRFRHLDASMKPLQRLTLAHSYERSTKTDVTRLVPVHPTLAAMLAEWKLGGFRTLAERPASDSEWVVPGVRGGMRSRHRARKDFLMDLKTLGLRHRRVQDSRRTFISMARDGGARTDVLKMITHTPARSMIDEYSSLAWETLCEAVLCVSVVRGVRPKRGSGETT